MRKLLLIWTLSGIYSCLMGQSCGWMGMQSIAPNQTDTFTLAITDLLNADLGNGQSLCRVSLKFSHQWARELQLELISPAGQKVLLMAEVKTGPGSSLLATWDIDFVACADKARPDEDFPAVWDHRVNNYLLGGEYRGTYYPSVGCLGEFNSGSANGDWKLVLTSGNSSGILNGLRLSFCDPSGIECCFANGGKLQAVEVGTYCEGDSGLLFKTILTDYTFPEEVPRTEEYGYAYLVVSPEGIQEVLFEGPDLTNLPAGNYQIKGLSYARRDSVTLFQNMPEVSLEELEVFLEGSFPDSCASLATGAVNLEILPKPALQSDTFRICPGGAVLVQGEELDQEGTYLWTFASANGCDSIIEAVVLLVKPEDQLTGTKTLNCLSQDMELGLALSNPEDFQFSWVGPGITGADATSEKIRAVAGGDYQLTLTEKRSGCSFISSTTVVLDTIAPMAFLDPVQVLDCQRDTILLNGLAETFSGEAQVSWYKDEELVLNEETNSLVITEPATYRLIVRDQLNGCVDTAITLVGQEGKPIQSLVWSARAEICEEGGTIQVEVDSILGGTGPFSFSLNEQVPTQNRKWTGLFPGEYSLRVVDKDGCSLELPVSLGELSSINIDLGPDRRVFPGETILIEANIAGQWDSLTWIPAELGSTGDPLSRQFLANESTLIILRAEGPLGCSGMDSLNVLVSSESVYFPTAFSPNGDGVNDIFYVQGGKDIIRVLELTIYDRWGSQVFNRQDFAPNDPLLGWDGIVAGKRASSNVYLYQVDVLFIGGLRQQFQGEFLLLGTD